MTRKEGRWGRSPIIAVSGGGRTHTMQFLEVARKLDADLVPPKPVKQQQLVEAILQPVEGKPDRKKETEL